MHLVSAVATILSLLWAVLVDARSSADSGSAVCSPSQNLAFVCGMDRPEDLAHIPATRWLIASGFSEGAGLKLVDTRARTMRSWYTGQPDQQRFDVKAFGACPSAPDARLLNVQGISLRRRGADRYTLHATNHGGRESVEIFEIDASGDEPTLTWTGCVLTPPGIAANSVATYSDGTILISVLTHPGKTITDFVRGDITGGVYERAPGQPAFHLIHGTELPGNNGLETSQDDNEFYVVAFGWHAVLVFRRQGMRGPVRKAVAPDFMPDNIHWSSGKLILAGMRYDEPACGGLRKIVDGKADDMRCHRGYTVAQLDPVTMDFHILDSAGPNPAFNGVSAAVFVGKQLWLGSYQAKRVAVSDRR
jgi:hypothetical protein